MYISQDPISIAGGLNVYAYVHDTNSWIDPLGLSCCPNPNGKKGGKAHQDKIKQIIDDIESRGLVAKQEYYVKTLGGNKNTRFVDVVAQDPKTGNVIEYHQVGKQRITDGKPISREQKAINDLENEGKLGNGSVTFHPYN